MGVSWIFPLPEAASRAGPQSIDDLRKHLEMLGAQRIGQFYVDSELYFPKVELGVSKTVHICHASDYPSTTFALMPESQGNVRSLVADNMFDQLLAKLSNFYNTRQGMKAECRGPKYSLGDFSIKIGSVTVGSSFKGVIMEVEYCPCQIISLCNELIKEFCDALLLSTGAATAGSISPPIYIQNRSSTGQAFRPIDSINQYVELFHQYRRATVAGAPTTKS